MALKKSQRSLRAWTKQKWRTKSGKKSSETGERYLPEKAIKSLSAAEYAATTRKKRKDTKAGKQFSKQPKRIAKKTRRARQFKFIGGRVGFSDGGNDFAEKIREALISRKDLVEKVRENALVGEDGTVYPNQFMKQKSESAYDRAKMKKYRDVSETVFDVKNRMNYGNIKGNNEKERYESLQKLIKEKGVKERKGDYVELLHPYEVARLGYPYNLQDGMNAYRFYTEKELIQDKGLRDLLRHINSETKSILDPRGKTAFERNVGNIR
mgnify:FL=1|tara:strand:- start:454 stop:1254 length:801 start_codon:yes stop_codon:yes gene_type:complete